SRADDHVVAAVPGRDDVAPRPGRRNPVVPRTGARVLPQPALAEPQPVRRDLPSAAHRISAASVRSTALHLAGGCPVGTHRWRDPGAPLAPPRARAEPVLGGTGRSNVETRPALATRPRAADQSAEAAPAAPSLLRRTRGRANPRSPAARCRQGYRTRHPDAVQ